MLADCRIIQAIILISFICLSCQKEMAITFEDYSIPTDDEITGLHFWSDQYILAIGGDTWKRGIRAYSDNHGQTWLVDSIQDKKLFSVSSGSGSLTIGMGIGFTLHKFYFTDHQRIDIAHTGDFKFIRSVSLLNDTLAMAVHGLGNGQIFKIHPGTGEYQIVHEVDRELNTIAHLNEEKWFAAGFGIVLRTNNTGVSWDTLPISGDQYVDLSISPDSTIVLLGSSGTVYQSLDKGQIFNKIRSAGIISSAPLFTSICFKNKMEGLIGGEASALMKTKDGGRSWIQLTGIPAMDIRSIVFYNGHYWICGNKGRVIKLSE